MEWSKKLTIFISVLMVGVIGAYFWLYATYGHDAETITLAVLGFGTTAYGFYFTKAGVENFQKIKKVANDFTKYGEDEI